MAIIQKKALALLAFILIFFILLILILFSLKFYIALKANTLGELILQEEKALQSTQFQNFKTKVTAINQDLSKTQTLLREQILLVPVLEKLSSLTPPTIYFTDLSLKKDFTEVENPNTKQKERKFFADLHIDGFASTRAVLFSFKQSLETEPTFEEIYFLPSSWVRPVEVDFFLSLKFLP